MRKIKLILLFSLCVCMLLAVCGCGEKPIPQYNTAVPGRTVDKTDVKSVIENALLADVYDKLTECEAIASVYHEYAKDQTGKKVTYYVVATQGGYVHENGKLARKYGFSPFAAVVTLKQGENGYDVVGFNALRSFEEDEEREAFIEENFPEGTDSETLFKGRAAGLFEAEKQQIIKNYGFDEGEFAGEDEMIELLPVTNEAYYTLIEFFPEYPEWLGDTTKVKNGVRFTYATSYKGEDGGKGVVTYIKTNENGEEVERYDIPVDGDNVDIPDELIADEWEDDFTAEDFENAEPIIVEPGESATTRTPEELEEIMKEYDYDDGIEYTLVD